MQLRGNEPLGDASAGPRVRTARWEDFESLLAPTPRPPAPSAPASQEPDSSLNPGFAEDFLPPDSSASGDQPRPPGAHISFRKLRRQTILWDFVSELYGHLKAVQGPACVFVLSGEERGLLLRCLAEAASWSGGCEEGVARRQGVPCFASGMLTGQGARRRGCDEGAVLPLLPPRPGAAAGTLPGLRAGRASRGSVVPPWGLQPSLRGAPLLLWWRFHRSSSVHSLSEP